MTSAYRAAAEDGSAEAARLLRPSGPPAAPPSGGPEQLLNLPAAGS
jgi:hypothetical protein